MFQHFILYFWQDITFLVQQIQHSYAANRRAENPLQVSYRVMWGCLRIIIIAYMHVSMRKHTWLMHWCMHTHRCTHLHAHICALMHTLTHTHTCSQIPSLEYMYTQTHICMICSKSSKIVWTFICIASYFFHSHSHMLFKNSLKTEIRKSLNDFFLFKRHANYGFWFSFCQIRV